MSSDKSYTEPCECARLAIERGYLSLDPDCAANKCKEMRNTAASGEKRRNIGPEMDTNAKA